ncbi:hypothetical protein BARRIGA_102 [Mycobacterium phage Barriga]|uniref:hypothetical protein n=1 Tax=Mycobacterium phage Barriga TaxID=1675548 RepID=UPI0006A265F8|nr:hypothetical protein BARRIGA_102 [Mycobacterium phage Barriga]AKU44970.1 hypothetical protein BARRIGA_102 [Mycobacterium phage Barriga]
MTPSAGVHPVYHTPTRQRNPLCAASLRTPAGVPRTLPTRPRHVHTLRTHTSPPCPAYPPPVYPAPPAAPQHPCLCDALCARCDSDSVPRMRTGSMPARLLAFRTDDTGSRCSRLSVDVRRRYGAFRVEA